MRDWSAIVGANIKRRRMEIHLTQEDVALSAEIDLTYMGGIERGRRNPSLKVLARIADVLEVTPGDLLGIPSAVD